MYRRTFWEMSLGTHRENTIATLEDLGSLPQDSERLFRRRGYTSARPGRENTATRFRSRRCDSSSLRSCQSIPRKVQAS